MLVIVNSFNHNNTSINLPIHLFITLYSSCSSSNIIQCIIGKNGNLFDCSTNNVRFWKGVKYLFLHFLRHCEFAYITLFFRLIYLQIKGKPPKTLRPSPPPSSLMAVKTLAIGKKVFFFLMARPPPLPS